MIEEKHEQEDQLEVQQSAPSLSGIIFYCYLVQYLSLLEYLTNLRWNEILYYKIQSVCVIVCLSVCSCGIGSQTMRTTVMNLLQVTQWV